MFKLDLDDTLNDRNIQALAKDTELQFDMTFISTKLNCLMKKLDMIVNQQGEKCTLREQCQWNDVCPFRRGRLVLGGHAEHCSTSFETISHTLSNYQR